MGVLDGNPKNEPLHYGEVFGTWTYLKMSHGCVIAYQTFINHAGDDDLKDLLKEVIEANKDEIKQIEKLLKKNGVALPPKSPERSNADSNDIPNGARVMDPEISAVLSADIAKGLVDCSAIIGQSIREDIAVMFGKFHMDKSILGAKALRLSKDKGWLIPPPLHSNTPDNDES